MFRTLVAAGALTLASTFLNPAFADENRMNRTISLSGHGEVRAAPDMAMVMIGVISQNTTAAEALKANTAAMQSVFAKLKAAGIENKDVQTSNFSVQPRYDYNNNSPGEPPRLVGYDVANSVTVVVRNLAVLGGVLDAVVQAGSNQINGIQFQVSKPDAAIDEARKLAVADAAHKAKIYASASSVQLGDIVSMQEIGGGQPPIVMQAKMFRAEVASDVPMAQGEQAISVDVNVAWEIK